MDFAGDIGEERLEGVNNGLFAESIFFVNELNERNG